MFRIRHQIALVFLTLVFTSSCQAVATTSLALGNRFSSAANENGSPVPLRSDDLDATTLGTLTWRGGLAINSEDPNFGGLSGLLITGDGTGFLAVSDKGFWVKGTLLYQRGELDGVRDIEIAPMLGLDGMAIEGKALGDAESLIGDPVGCVLVSFERKHRVWSYDLSEDGFAASPTTLAMPDDVANTRSNGGLEGIAQLKDKAGTILALTEATTDGDGNFKGWLVTPGSSSPVALKPIKPFNLTDLAVLPGGDVLTLERRFSPVGGPGYQIRRIDGASIQPGAVLDGPVLANAGLPWTVDNMEGLDVRITSDGRTLLYILSDDNFNPLQRTLLMMFELNE